MTVDEVVTAVSGGAEPRAGGTDVMARHRIGLAAGPFADLPPALHGVSREPDGSLRIGAMTTIAELGGLTGHPVLALVARALGTPQIRSTGTLGGNLLQRNRCWYFRNPAFSCHQKGGDACPARSGDSRFSAVIHSGPCVAAHPSSLAVALLAYDAVVEVHGRADRALADLYGDGSDPTRDHLLHAGEILTAVRVPAPVPGELAAHRRVTARVAGEWPLAEVAARLVLDGPVVTFAAVTAGAVGRTPVRLSEVEAALVGAEPTPETLRAAADHATRRCTPLAGGGPGDGVSGDGPYGNSYKVDLLREATLEVLETALNRP